MTWHAHRAPCPWEGAKICNTENDWTKCYAFRSIIDQKERRKQVLFCGGRDTMFDGGWRSIVMGMTHVTVTVRKPAIPDKTWEGLFLVDTGAVDSLVPRKHLAEIGLVPKAKRTYELADGSEVKMDITTGELEFMGDLVGATIIIGADDAEPILGVTALESVGIEVDPRTQRLKRLPAPRLK